MLEKDEEHSQDQIQEQNPGTRPAGQSSSSTETTATNSSGKKQTGPSLLGLSASSLRAYPVNEECPSSTKLESSEEFKASQAHPSPPGGFSEHARGRQSDQRKTGSFRIAKYSDSSPLSVAELQVPDAELLQAFQLVDGEDVLAAGREGPRTVVRPSYIEGLNAIRASGLPAGVEDQLQADHSSQYMERKFREWQEREKARESTLQAPVIDRQELLKNANLQKPDDAAGTFQALTIDSKAAALPESLDKSRLQSAAGNAMPCGAAPFIKSESSIDFLNESESASIKESANAKNEDTANWPFSGKEFAALALCTKSDTGAWLNSYQSYTYLQEILDRREAVSLMKALVINEIHLYEIQDLERDSQAAKSKIESDSLEPLGFSQLTPKIVQELTGGYFAGRRLKDEDIFLKDYLKKKGHVGAGFEANALLDPTCLPMIVASRLDSIILYLSQTRDRVTEDKWINLTGDVIAYSYSPDVFFNPRGHDDQTRDFHPVYRNEFYFERVRGYERAFPTACEHVLNVSRHLDNVLYWLDRLTKKNSY